MTVAEAEKQSTGFVAASSDGRPRPRRSKPAVGTSLLARGEPMVWLTGGSLAIAVIMIVGLLALVLYNGLSAFWPKPLEQVQLVDDSTVLGRVTRQNDLYPDQQFVTRLNEQALIPAVHELLQSCDELSLASLSAKRDEISEVQQDSTEQLERARTRQAGNAEQLARAEDRFAKTQAAREQQLAIIDQVEQALQAAGVQDAKELDQANLAQLPGEQVIALGGIATTLEGHLHRRLFNDANFDVDNNHFTWVFDYEIKDGPKAPHNAIIMDRFGYREFIGYVTGMTIDGKSVATGYDQAMEQYDAFHDEAMARRSEAEGIEKHDIGHYNYLLQAARLSVVDARIGAVDGQSNPQLVHAWDHYVLIDLSVNGSVAALLSASARLEQAQSQGAADRVEPLQAGIDEFVKIDPANADALPLAQAALADDEQLRQLALEPAFEASGEYRSAIRSGDAGSDLARLVELGPVGYMDAMKHRIDELRAENARFVMQLETADGRELSISLGDVEMITASNQLGLGGKLGVYASRWWRYLSADPREANMAGGIFPHIFGTVLMVIIMCILVVPFGVLAALYIREYAKAGLIVSVIRIAINNLAGVPSIVYGVFGLGFFIYVVGAYMDGGPSKAGFSPLPSGGWFLLLLAFAMSVAGGAMAMYVNRRRFIKVESDKNTLLNILALMLMAAGVGYVFLTYLLPALMFSTFPGFVARALVLGAIGVLIFLGAKPIMTDRNDRRSTFERAMAFAGVLCCILGGLCGVGLVAAAPFFEGFADAHVASGSPFWGKGALVWASFTLALLTLPVVIVATEEALSAVPNSMREGSYACGASKWQTIKRIVLPRAMPGIMTGTILAMARGAGEVAPLMIVGVVAFTQELPFSTNYGEAFGINRSFLHLGFHIYNMGFQSQDSEGAKPLVYVTTLLLIMIVAVLNFSAITLRARLKRRFVSSAF